MMAFLQRVRSAAVEVEGRRVAAIDQGLMVLLGVEKNDSEADARRIVDRLLGYRVFADDSGRMNLSLVDCAGGLLLVPQFTLAADTQKGTRPSFTPAASPEQGRHLFDLALVYAQQRHASVVAGVFGAHMQVHLVNDGPVSFMLRARATPS